MKKHENNFTFIDSQNLNLGIRDQGWKLDFARFLIYLKDRFFVKKAFIFVGYIKENEKIYKILRDAGYTLIFKPTLTKNGIVKGNVDAELVLHAMIEYQNYDKAIIVSGDGDFYCLVKYLEEKNKLKRLVVPNRDKYSILFEEFYRCGKISFLTGLELKLGKKVHKKRRRNP